MYIFGSTFICFTNFFAQLPAAYVTGGHIFSLQHYNRQQHKTSWFFSLNRRLKECVLGRPEIATACLYDCAHIIRILALSGPPSTHCPAQPG